MQQTATGTHWYYFKLSPRNTSLLGAGSLINYCIQCCSSKCVIASSPGIKKNPLWFIVLSYIHGINSPRFKLPTWYHKSWSWEEILTISSLGHQTVPVHTDCRWSFYSMFSYYLTWSVILQIFFTTCCLAQSQCHIV